jgi:hypothetical protein
MTAYIRWGSKVSRARADIESLAAQGMDRQRIADAVGLSYQTVSMFAKTNGIAIARKKAGQHETAERDAAMKSIYRQGMTLQVIGEKYNVTRERVRQILARAGVDSKCGGPSVQASLKRNAAERSRVAAQARRAEKWGVPFDLLAELRSNGTIRAFEQQRQNSRKRGIVWKLTFGQWFAVWQASGKLHLRGRGKGRYCMSRHRDEGGYELGNVHIQLCTTNSSEGFGKARGKPKAFTGVFCVYPGRELAWLAKVGKVRLGYFASAEAAHEARNDYLTENSIRPGSLGRGRGWTIRKNNKTRPYMMRCAGTSSYHATQAEAEAAYAAAVAAVRAERAAPEQATEWALL